MPGPASAPGSGWRRPAALSVLALLALAGLGAPPAAAGPPAPGASNGASTPAAPAVSATPGGSAPAASGASAPRIEREPTRRRWERPLPRGRVLAAQAEERWGRWALGGSGDPAHPAGRPGFHPGTRVRIDARPLEGRLPPRARVDRRTGRRERVLTAAALVAAARRQGYWPARLCFEDAVRRVPELQGRVRWSLRVDPRGRVRDVSLVGSAWKDADGEDCLAAVLGGLRLPPPPAAVRVAVDVSVWPGDVPLPARPPLAVGGRAAPGGELALPAVDAALAALGDGPERCLAAARAADPALWGRLALRLVLDERGRLLRIRQEETRFPAAAAVDCVASELRRGAWPPALGGEAEAVVAWRLYPIDALEPYGLPPRPAAAPGGPVGPGASPSSAPASSAGSGPARGAPTATEPAPPAPAPSGEAPAPAGTAPG